MMNISGTAEFKVVTRGDSSLIIKDGLFLFDRKLRRNVLLNKNAHLREEAGCRKRLRESSERAKAHSFLCHCAIKTTGRRQAVKRDKKQEESIHVYKL